MPRTDTLLDDPALAEPIARLGRGIVKDVIAAVQERVRSGLVPPQEAPAAVLAALPVSATSMRAVLNATGTVLHTNLGRSALSDAAIEAIRLASGATDVELDLAENQRAPRGRGALQALARAAPNAQSAHVVNNGAAALFLAACALAGEELGPDGETRRQARDIIVSRGELVEIGDGFRLHELLAASGARLVAVGSTNRTSLRDYARAISDRTAFLLKVHPSNFVVTGFTSSVPVRELCGLGAPVVADIGSGLLAPDPLLPDEPDAATTLADGAALVVASGDKLLGGPQCGLLLGDAAIVERLRRHPVARALRVDKLTLAALEATVRGPRTPTWLALHADPGELRSRAERICDRLRAAGVSAQMRESAGVVGGGGAPGLSLPGSAIALDGRYGKPLRTGHPPVVGRVEKGMLLLDLRCVPSDRDHDLCAAVLRAAQDLA